MENPTQYNDETKRKLFVGFVGWLSVAIGALSAYMLTLQTIGDWSWFTVAKGAVAQVATGLGLLAGFLGRVKNAEQSTINSFMAPVDVSGFPTLLYARDHSDAGMVIETDNFKRHELVCKGIDCDCEYQGMDPVLMDIAEDVRRVFGVQIVNSGRRCKYHNEAVGGSDDSYHMKGMALDLRQIKVPPKQVYDYLDAKYPKQYGLGLYNSFVHVDTRQNTWARKPAPDRQWREFQHKTADVEL